MKQIGDAYTVIPMILIQFSYLLKFSLEQK